MNTEFKVGDNVTYFPYEKELPAIVKDVSLYNMQGKKDGRVYYTLRHIEGATFNNHVRAITTGQCIKESKYFKQWDGKE